MEYYLRVLGRRFILLSVFLLCFAPIIFPTNWKYKDIWKITSGITTTNIKYECDCKSSPVGRYSLGFKYTDKNGKSGEIVAKPNGAKVTKLNDFDFRPNSKRLEKIQETKTVHIYRSDFIFVWCALFGILFIILHCTLCFPGSFGSDSLYEYVKSKFIFANNLLVFFGYDVNDVNDVPNSLVHGAYYYSSYYLNDVDWLFTIISQCKTYNLKNSD